MNGLTVIENTAIVEQRTINADLFSRWTSYIDASPKTIETYSKAIRRFFVYLMENGITQPQREDIVAYRDYLKLEHKPTTVQGYLAAVKLFFPVDSARGALSQCSRQSKRGKAGY